MPNLYPDPSILFIVLGVGWIIFLWIFITVTYLFSFHVLKIDRPKLKWLILIALIQVLLMILAFITIISMKNFTFNMLIVLLYVLVVLILSGLILVKLVLNLSWKQTFSIWALAGSLQLVITPISFMVTLLIGALIAILSLPNHCATCYDFNFLFPISLFSHLL